MKSYNIAVVPGDGIGKEVVPEGIRVLEAVGAQFGIRFAFRSFEWSCETYKNTGRMMPEDGLARLRDHDAIFLGAVGFPGVPDHVSLWGLLIPIRRRVRSVRESPPGASPAGAGASHTRSQTGRYRFLGGAREYRGRVLPDRWSHLFRNGPRSRRSRIDFYAARHGPHHPLCL